jgi:Pyrimidine dimer DNA glycosylase
MLTFLPMIGFFKSLRELDDARLGKQRQDALNILEALLAPEKSRSDPSTPNIQMWAGFEYTLAVYGMSACSVWQNERGNRDKLAFEIHAVIDPYPKDLLEPPWLGDLNFHRSHRSYLIHKYPDFYAARWPNTPERMPLLWPQLVDRDPRGYRLRLSPKDKALLDKGERKLPEWLEHDKHRNEVIEVEEDES